MQIDKGMLFLEIVLARYSNVSLDTFIRELLIINKFLGLRV